jgi:hypothetical protein
MNLTDVPDEVFTSKLLDPKVHERLIADLDQVVSTAGVPRSAVWTPLSSACTPAEVAWVRYLRNPDNAGLVIIGTSVELKMTAIVGACLRNYTDARMMSVQECLRRVKDDSLPQCTVLLIPNFCLGKDDGGDIPTWEVSGLLGMLIDRSARPLKTVISVPSMAVVEKQYGKNMRRLIETRFCVSAGDELYPPQA